MEKLKFRTAFTGHERATVPTGNGYEDVYEYEVDQYGRKTLKKTGEKCLYDEIQAQLEETKIENILARAAAGEDVFRKNAQFADCTELPSNLIEARQAIQQLENTWNGLTQAMRSKYNNSIEDFISSSGTKEWMEDMGMIPVELPKEINEGTDPAKGLAPLGQTETGGKIDE